MIFRLLQMVWVGSLLIGFDQLCFFLYTICVNEWMIGWMDGWLEMDGWMGEGWVDKWRGWQMDGWKSWNNWQINRWRECTRQTFCLKNLIASITWSQNPPLWARNSSSLSISHLIFVFMNISKPRGWIGWEGLTKPTCGYSISPVSGSSPGKSLQNRLWKQVLNNIPAVANDTQISSANIHANLKRSSLNFL